jgi:hypothetical protein
MELQHSSVSSIKPELIAFYSRNASPPTEDVRSTPDPANGFEKSIAESGSLRHAQLYDIILSELYQIELIDLLQLLRWHNPLHNLSRSHPELHHPHHNPPTNPPQFSPSTHPIPLLLPLPPRTHPGNLLLPLLRSLKPLHHSSPLLPP